LINGTGKEADGILFLTCDQPFVDAKLINCLIERFLEDQTGIVCCRYQDSLGVPALFPRRLFAQLKDLKGDCGARKVIMDNQSSLIAVDFPDGAYDVDTRQDWQNVTALGRRR
jgi:molybdenum cofactor cytidylyltransferase